MNTTFASKMIGGNADKVRRNSDFYPTPPEVTNALLDFLELPTSMVIWEPACGDNRMVDVMRARGHKVIATDIQTGTDFLECPLHECDFIITNPPFSIADKFIERCIEHDKPFAMLLKSQYWHARKRLPLFRKLTPSYVLPLTWRPDFTGEGKAPLMDVMWVVWCGNTPACYIPLEKPKDGAR